MNRQWTVAARRRGFAFLLLAGIACAAPQQGGTPEKLTRKVTAWIRVKDPEAPVTIQGQEVEKVVVRTKDETTREEKPGRIRITREDVGMDIITRGGIIGCEIDRKGKGTVSEEAVQVEPDGWTIVPTTKERRARSGVKDDDEVRLLLTRNTEANGKAYELCGPPRKTDRELAPAVTIATDQEHHAVFEGVGPDFFGIARYMQGNIVRCLWLYSLGAYSVPERILQTGETASTHVIFNGLRPDGIRGRKVLVDLDWDRSKLKLIEPAEQYATTLGELLDRDGWVGKFQALQEGLHPVDIQLTIENAVRPEETISISNTHAQPPPVIFIDEDPKPPAAANRFLPRPFEPTSPKDEHLLLVWQTFHFLQHLRDNRGYTGSLAHFFSSDPKDNFTTWEGYEGLSEQEKEAYRSLKQRVDELEVGYHCRGAEDTWGMAEHGEVVIGKVAYSFAGAFVATDYHPKAESRFYHLNHLGAAEKFLILWKCVELAQINRHLDDFLKGKSAEEQEKWRQLFRYDCADWNCFMFATMLLKCAPSVLGKTKEANFWDASGSDPSNAILRADYVGEWLVENGLAEKKTAEEWKKIVGISD